MLPKEKTELIVYLKKETTRLTKAINKANENQRPGRAGNYEQIRDALLNTLSELLAEKSRRAEF